MGNNQSYQNSEIVAKNNCITTWKDNKGRVYNTKSKICNCCNYWIIFEDNTDFDTKNGTECISHDWEHCCGCGISYPVSKTTRFCWGLSCSIQTDDLDYDHCCNCQVAFTGKQLHCCRCKKVFYTSHKCETV